MAKDDVRVPYALSVHGQEEVDAVVGVLKSSTAYGTKGLEFEQQVAALFGKQHGIMVNSGSSANLLAFELLRHPIGIEEGAEVITPALTFSTTVAPIIQKGLLPVFVDVEPGRFTANLDQVEAAITAKTKVLMVPNLIGSLPDMERLHALAERHHLIYIEDSCDTLGGKFKGKPTGSYSHVTTTSFYGSHIINGAGGGGMVMVDDLEWARTLLVLRGWGRRSSLYGEAHLSEDPAKRFDSTIDGIPYDNKFIFSEVGYNFLPLELSAAFGLVQLTKLPEFEQRRREHVARLRAFFGRWPELFEVGIDHPDADTNWMNFPVTIKEAATFERLELCKYLENRNIQTRPVFTGNILRQPGFTNIPHRNAVDEFPVAERVMRRSFVLGCHQGLTDEQLSHVEQSVTDFVTNKK